MVSLSSSALSLLLLLFAPRALAAPFTVCGGGLSSLMREPINSEDPDQTATIAGALFAADASKRTLELSETLMDNVTHMLGSINVVRVACSKGGDVVAYVGHFFDRARLFVGVLGNANANASTTTTTKLTTATTNNFTLVATTTVERATAPPVLLSQSQPRRRPQFTCPLVAPCGLTRC